LPHFDLEFFEDLLLLLDQLPYPEPLLPDLPELEELPQLSVRRYPEPLLPDLPLLDQLLLLLDQP
jgi:hypothetical protein